MLLLPLHTPLLRPGDHLAAILAESGMVREGDILAVSSKAMATTEGAMVDLSRLTPGMEAKRFAGKTGRTAAFMQAVLDETKRLRGTPCGTSPGALLTELRPAGLPKGTILTANAGLDQSNVQDGWAIGWPRDPVGSLKKLRVTLPSHTALILTDSNCRPRRIGVTAFALACAGIDPLLPQRGTKDLFGKELLITTEATADQLATAANFLMGNAEQGIPAVIIRDHGLPFSDFAGWVPGIEPEEDLFRGVI